MKIDRDFLLIGMILPLESSHLCLYDNTNCIRLVCEGIQPQHVGHLWRIHRCRLVVENKQAGGAGVPYLQYSFSDSECVCLHHDKLPRFLKPSFGNTNNGHRAVNGVVFLVTKKHWNANHRSRTGLAVDAWCQRVVIVSPNSSSTNSGHRRALLQLNTHPTDKKVYQAFLKLPPCNPIASDGGRMMANSSGSNNLAGVVATISQDQCLAATVQVGGCYLIDGDMAPSAAIDSNNSSSTGRAAPSAVKFEASVGMRIAGIALASSSSTTTSSASNHLVAVAAEDTIVQTFAAKINDLSASELKFSSVADVMKQSRCQPSLSLPDLCFRFIPMTIKQPLPGERCRHHHQQVHIGLSQLQPPQPLQPRLPHHCA